MVAAWSSRRARTRLVSGSGLLDSTEARPLAGTDGGDVSILVAGSRSIGFAADGVLKRIDLDTGLVRTLASRFPAGGAWSAEGTILIGSIIGPLYSIQDEGGELKEATRLLRGQNSHRWPQFLPDGRRFLMFTLGVPDVRVCIADPRPTRTWNEYRIERPVTGSCRLRTCCSPGKALCGQAE